MLEFNLQSNLFLQSILCETTLTQNIKQAVNDSNINRNKGTYGWILRVWGCSRLSQTSIIIIISPFLCYTSYFCPILELFFLYLQYTYFTRALSFSVVLFSFSHSTLNRSLWTSLEMMWSKLLLIYLLRTKSRHKRAVIYKTWNWIPSSELYFVKRAEVRLRELDRLRARGGNTWQRGVGERGRTTQNLERKGTLKEVKISQSKDCKYSGGLTGPSQTV